MSTLSAAIATIYSASAQRNADVHRILSSSTFFAPLTHSLTLTRGSGSPTFTRATTATVFDNEGKLITVPSGASRHVGARYVRNLFSSSATIASGSAATVSGLAAGTYTFSMGAGTGTATFSGTGGATGTLTASALGRVEVTKTITAGTFIVTASVAALVDIQLENVTGQADKTASEYVAVGPDTECAWFDATGTINFPKGCNNNALGDTNDIAVNYVSDGYSNCGKTGSATNFAKTTHNGQNCGVADLNGNMWEVSPGITCVSGTKPITGATQANPVSLTVVGHGLATGAIVQITSVVGMTQINDKLFAVTVVDADHITLNGTDGSAFTAYSSAGTLTYGTFYALNTSYAAKDLTGGNTLSTDQWGATGVAAHSSPIAVTFRTDYAQNGFDKRYGRSANAVLDPAMTGAGWALTGLGMPMASGISDGTTGSNLFGADYLYQYIRNDLCLLSGAYWNLGSNAGAWAAYWSAARTNSGDGVGFRAASYLNSVIPTDFDSVSDVTRTAGVGVCPRLEAGFSDITGTTISGHDNYGNYQYSEGSIMVWIAVHYYKIVDNNIVIKPYNYFSNLSEANAAGYTIHRSFYDAGQLQPGYFIDKYEASNNSGIASSIKNGNPLSTSGAHNPIGSLTGLSASDNIYSGVFKAAKTRGTRFFPATRFIYAGLALLATAHGIMKLKERNTLGVDGIKAFNTHKNGTPISYTLLEGYLSEPAATNNILYCRDLLAGAKAGSWIPSTTGTTVLSDDFSMYADNAALQAAWTGYNGTPTLSSATMRITASGANAGSGKSFATIAGKTYVAKLQLVTPKAGVNAFIYVGTGNGNSSLGSINMGQTAGLYSITFIATGTTTWITPSLAGISVAGDYFEVDNVTVKLADIVPALTATGIDGVLNSATTLTVVVDNATILQQRTLTSAARSSSAYIKRRTGSGSVYFTRDGGTTWTDITSSLSTTGWYRAKIENSSVTNPSVGFKLATSGDAIDVDYVQDEANVVATSPLLTTTATVTRNIDILTYPNTVNNAVGTAYCAASTSVDRPLGAINFLTVDANGRMLCLSSVGLRTQIEVYDGASSGALSGVGLSLVGTTRKRASAWGGTSRVAVADGAIGAPYIFDGSMGATTTLTVGNLVGVGYLYGKIKDVHIWDTALTHEKLKAITR